MKQLGILLTLLFFCFSNKAAQEQIDRNDVNLELYENYFDTPASPTHDIPYELTKEDEEIINNTLQELNTQNDNTQQIKVRRGPSSQTLDNVTSENGTHSGKCKFCNQIITTEGKFDNLRQRAFKHRQENPECQKKYAELKESIKSDQL